MFTKNITLSLIILVSILTIWWFALPFKAQVVDPLKTELSSLQDARDKYKDQINIDDLQRKVTSLNEVQKKVLDSYIPKELRSGRLVYNIAQLAQQNRLNIKGVQYSVVDSQASQLGKRLVMEFQVEGFYENIVSWVRTVELSDVLVDVESIKGSKINNTSDIIGFTVKMSAYGVRID
jgi:hypothetical protein